MAVLVSNLGTQNRDFTVLIALRSFDLGVSSCSLSTVLIWVRELLPSRSGMARFPRKVKDARDKAGMNWVY